MKLDPIFPVEFPGAAVLNNQKWGYELVANELRSICFDRGGSLLACKNKILRAEKNETYEFNKINPALASRVVFRVPLR